MLVAGQCMGVALIGILIGLGDIGELPVWWRAICAVFCVLLAFSGLVNTIRRRRTYHVDISGAGQIRLRTDNIGQRELSARRSQEPSGDEFLVRLMADSTIWARFLMLRLQSEDGNVHIVPIFCDCLPQESFRAISVACRWIAAHNLTQQRIM
jgi:toxin CptA